MRSCGSGSLVGFCEGLAFRLGQRGFELLSPGVLLFRVSAYMLFRVRCDVLFSKQHKPLYVFLTDTLFYKE